MLSCSHLDVGVGDRTLVRDLSLRLAGGDLVCMLGPNGVGKTLTLHTLAGLWPPLAGTVQLDGRSLGTMGRRHIARRLGLLLQDDADTFPATVLDAALLGRHPHIGPWASETLADTEIVQQALGMLDLAGLESRPVATLSGGERRRVALARLLAQQADVMLLDEPVNQLDPRHQGRVLSTLQRLADSGKVVVISLHDPVLARRFARSTLLLFGDGAWEFGPASQLLTPARLERVFQTRYERFVGADGAVYLPALPAAADRADAAQNAIDPTRPVD